MAHFALVDENNIVQNVLVFDLPDGEIPGPEHTIPEGWKWIQTSYNSKKGVHYHPNSDIPSGKPHLRYNYASVGHIYKEDTDGFHVPSPWPSWIWNEEHHSWEPPTHHPEDGNLYRWLEPCLAYVKEPVQENLPTGFKWNSEKNDAEPI
jgi:hypothetical protein